MRVAMLGVHMHLIVTGIVLSFGQLCYNRLVVHMHLIVTGIVLSFGQLRYYRINEMLY